MRLYLSHKRYFLPDVLFASISIFALILGLAGALFLVFFIAKEALPAFSSIADFLDLLFRNPWEPLADPVQLGIRHAIISTLLVTLLCLCIAVPFGVGMGIFSAEVAPPQLAVLIQPCLSALASVPAVVYGFVGFITVVPWVQDIFNLPTGETILAAALILALMVFPYIASVTSESLLQLPRDLKVAAFAQGVTHWYVLRRVLIPKAASGIFTAFTVGFTRAIGETMAVTMLAGNVVATPTSPLDRGQPITALITTELGEAGVNSPMYHSLFASGLLLLCIVALINFATWRLKSVIIQHV